MMGYTWVKDTLSQEEQIEMEAVFKVWADFWLKHVDAANNFSKLRKADTDDVTSVTKNLTLLGYVLADSHEHKEFGIEVLASADHILQNVVVDYYMKDIMKGGAWAEGSDYSPSTQAHWIQTFIINKDQRNIDYPLNYAPQAMQSLLHQTLANDTGVYKYGSEEKSIDYDLLEDDYRYEFSLFLMLILEDDDNLSLINNWFNKIIDEKGFKKGSMVTHFDRLLYHNPHHQNTIDKSQMATMHYAEGVGLVSARSSWEDDATNLYFINRKVRVDHEHKDALSFDVAYKGKWITKEVTGYGNPADSSKTHNTILIENADNGSSSPTRRPVDDPHYNTLFDNDDVTLISADATQTYNMTGYYAVNYALLVNRQLALLKPSTVIVYDHIITDNTVTKDLVAYNNLKLPESNIHNRWVKVIQHVQSQPQAIESNNNAFNIVDGDTSLVYQVITPSDADIEIVNEKNLWSNIPLYIFTENQKKWHFSVSNKTAKKENEFITTLNFSSNEVHSAEELVLAPFHLTIENGYILSGQARGLAVEAQNKKYIIVFNQSSTVEKHTVKIKRPTGLEDALVYGIGLVITE